MLNRSVREQQHTRTLEAQVTAQQTTIDFLHQQLQTTQRHQEQLLARVLGGAAPVTSPTHNGPQFGEPTFHNQARQPMPIQFAPPAPEYGGPSLPIPKGTADRRLPTPEQVAELYGETGGGLFEDVGDDKARELGLEHDDVTNTVQRGKPQPRM